MVLKKQAAKSRTHLCAEESAAGAASRLEDVEVDEPSTAVEFGIDGVDLPRTTGIDGLLEMVGYH